MYCPKCGAESVEAQRFCKACGTNLQLINDALRSGDSPQGPFGIDVDALTKNAKDFAESWKKSWSGASGRDWNKDRQNTTRELRRQAREEARRRNVPKPREYISYSWQHNLRNGLVSLFWGTGLGVVLYYLGQTAIDSGLIKQLEENPDLHVHVHGLEPLARMIWLIALLPVLKGLARIIYAAFFAESMATLTERYTGPPALPEPSPVLRQDTAPVAQQETARSYEPLVEQPPSVTENTTQFFEENQRAAKRESQ